MRDATGGAITRPDRSIWRRARQILDVKSLSADTGYPFAVLNEA
jgi:hypothetical protein